jgi:dipeptidyl aminopeptidase/acylaminoacyl peptidase
MKQVVMALALAAGFAAVPATAAVNVDAYVKRDSFDDIKLSPNGDYYAATVTLEDRTALVVLRRSDNKVTARIAGERNSRIDDFWWVNSERVVVSMAEKIGALDQPQPTGDLYAVNADGGSSDILVGQSVQSAGPGSKIQPKKVEQIAAFLVDDLPADEKNVIIRVVPFTADPYTRAEQLDVYSGRRRQIARAPVRNARFLTDNTGVVRFAAGSGSDNVRKIYYRTGEGAEWEIVGDAGASGIEESPLGFSADNQTAYFRTERDEGPDAIIAFDIATRTRKDVLRDDDTDPREIIYRNGTNIPVGAFFMDGKPRTAFFDNAAPEARLYRSLEAAFGGDPVRITSQTSDGRLALVQVWSDRNPGDFYVFDTVAKKADHLASRATWFDPEQMAEQRPVNLKARDGLVLHGYVTLPRGSKGSGLPMVVMPHGGPFYIQDVWGFNTQAQMLANAGYAVLQVNFRGSSGYGASFEDAGARQWGLKMQDDLTDATRWAVQQGIADGNRVCIYGGSYGGYASLMGVAKEPNLYKCAVGYVGIYDLPTMVSDEGVQQSGSSETWHRDWVGEKADLAATSPNRMAAKIKAPVFLVAGGEDETAPIHHSEMMEKALRTAGVPVETLYYPTEGHGFYKEDHLREYYTRLLAFLSKHLGGGVATVAAPGNTAGQ